MRIVDYKALLEEEKENYWAVMSNTRPWLQISKEALGKLKRENPGVKNEDLPLIICTFDSNGCRNCQHMDKCIMVR